MSCYVDCWFLSCRINMRQGGEGQGEIFLLEVWGFCFTEWKLTSESLVGIWDKSHVTDFLSGATWLSHVRASVPDESAFGFAAKLGSESNPSWINRVCPEERANGKRPSKIAGKRNRFLMANLAEVK